MIDIEEEPCPECGEYLLDDPDDEDLFCLECGWPHFHEEDEAWNGKFEPSEQVKVTE